MNWKGFGQKKLGSIDWLIVIFIVLLAFGIRFYRVGEVPAGIYCDEASIGYNAYALGKSGIDENGESWPLYIKSFGGYKNPVFVYAAILPIKILGLSEMSTRLTSVLFGTLTVLGLFWLSYEIWGKLAGFCTSFFLAITPWHIHFSRIAFELISWPCMFVFGFAFMVRGVRKGGWNWVGAGFMFGLAFHSYVMALMFLPFFLGIFALVFMKTLWKQKTKAIAGFIVLALMVLPGLQTRIKTKGSSHFISSSYIDENNTIQEKAQKFFRQYQQYYSKNFLFLKGDGLIRHNVQNHGELLKSFAPLIILGMVFMLIYPDPFNFMIICWLLLFPVGSALTNDVYASRSIVGSPLAALFGGYGVAQLLAVLTEIKWRWLRYPLIAITSFIVLGPLTADFIKYWNLYYGQYYRQSARGYYGFQFGYRDMIPFMESLKDRYPQKMLTSTEVNQPYIFVLFYTKLDPLAWKRGGGTGYKETTADDYSHYTLDKPTIYALRQHELQYFEDYTILKEIKAPDGVTEFVVTDVKKRKDFIRDWITLGLFENKANSRFNDSAPNPRVDMDKPFQGMHGQVKWQPMDNPTIKVNFNRFFGIKDPATNKNPEACCADAVTYVFMETEQQTNLELRGSNDVIKIWINDQPIFGPQPLSEERTITLPVNMAGGWNQISVRSCEGVGDWYFVVALTDTEGKNIPNIITRNMPPESFEVPEVIAKVTIPQEDESGKIETDEQETREEIENEAKPNPLELDAYNPHLLYLCPEDLADLNIIDELDIENTESELLHEFAEVYEKKAPYHHNYHTKILPYIAPLNSIRLEDHGRRIYTRAEWIIYHVDSEKDLYFAARYDQTGGGFYKITVNGHKTRGEMEFEPGEEAWNESYFKIPKKYLIDGENRISIVRTTDTASDAEMYYFWFIQ